MWTVSLSVRVPPVWLSPQSPVSVETRGEQAGGLAKSLRVALVPLPDVLEKDLQIL